VRFFGLGLALLGAGATLQVFEVAGDVLQPQLAHNLCRLIAEQDSELHSTAVQVST
jgi:hypothetical protein